MKVKGLALPLFALALTCTCGCGGGGFYKYDTLAYFNAPCRWAFVPAEQGGEKAVWQEVTALFSDIQTEVSLGVPASSISRFNAAKAGETVEIGAIAYDILTEAQALYTETEGAYNPAAGLYVDLWGFSPRVLNGEGEMRPYDRDKASVPDEEYLSAFMPLLDFSALSLFEEEGRYYAKKPEIVALVDGTEYTMELDLGGIAKGYACDKAAKIIRNAGYDLGFLNVGQSSMRVFAGEKGGDWEIEVNSPRAEISAGRFLSVKGKHVGVSTSGDYENYFTAEGRRYCHIIDPFTGYPANASPSGDGSGVVAASLFGVPATAGDALTTAVLVKGEEWAKAFLKTRYPEAKAVFTVWDGATGEYSVATDLKSGEYTLYAEIPVRAF